MSSIISVQQFKNLRQHLTALFRNMVSITLYGMVVTVVTLRHFMCYKTFFRIFCDKCRPSSLQEY